MEQEAMMVVRDHFGFLEEERRPMLGSCWQGDVQQRIPSDDCNGKCHAASVRDLSSIV